MLVQEKTWNKRTSISEVEGKPVFTQKNGEIVQELFILPYK